MKKKLIILIISLLVGTIITSCSLSEHARKPKERNNVPETTVSTEARTVESEGTDSAEPVEGDNMPEDKKSEVSWADALKFLYSGEVMSVSQSHNLEVSLVLKDGRTIVTVEPSIDAIFDEIAKCGADCSDIILVSE